MNYSNEKLEKNRIAQSIAKETLEEMKDILHPGMNEKLIHDIVCEKMIKKGSGAFWYHSLGALVLLGERSVLSISARDYIPDENNILMDHDILTIDVSPTFDSMWGDHARTFFFENGKYVSYKEINDPLYKRGIQAEIILHNTLIEEIKPSMSYEEAYIHLSDKIRSLGFINLDFHGNLGHSIEEDEKDRICLEMGNKKTFQEYGKPFTLEPHIALKGSKTGFKMEDIYYIDGDRFSVL